MIKQITLSTLLLAGLTLAVAQSTTNPANNNSGPSGIPTVTPSAAQNQSVTPSVPTTLSTPSMTPSMMTPSMMTPSMMSPSMPGNMMTPSMMTPSTPTTRTPSTRTPSMMTPSMMTPSMMSPSTPGATARLNVNTATLAQLQRAGVSASVAQSIVRNRPYSSQAELLRKVPALNTSSMQNMRSLFTY